MNNPTDALVRGTVSDPSYVLTLPEIRHAEFLHDFRSFDTADGVVMGRPGDVAITGYGGEVWPIKREVFLGTYMLLGVVGDHLVAQRLIHVRRAWKIESDDAVLDYGQDRGQVAAPREGWLYQSDDDDFGYINPDVNRVGHTEVGSEAATNERRWNTIYTTTVTALTCLPPFLAMIALLAFSLSVNSHHLAMILVASETILLLAGAALAGAMRRWKWALKACVQDGLKLCFRFQPAAQLLGERVSKHFPAMTLWRAAQQEMLPNRPSSIERCLVDSTLQQLVMTEVASTLEILKHEIHRRHRHERGAVLATLGVFVIIVFANACVLSNYCRISHEALEVVAIWLPSVIGAAHAYAFKKRLADRIGAMHEFSAQLKFVQTRLFQICSNSSPSDLDGRRMTANLRLLCRFVAEYSQREIRFGIWSEPEVPV